MPAARRVADNGRYADRRNWSGCIEFDVQMYWLDSTLDHLAGRPVCGYTAGGRAASEPTALAALALVAGGRDRDAQPALAWLTRIQATDGSVGIRQGEPPGWPTSLAVLAWSSANSQSVHDGSIARAIAWIVADQGKTTSRVAEFGHNPELPGWSYADATSCWLEPTALHVAALKAAGQSRHQRTRDGVRLLIDRQLNDGGCNYGNTTVLGQTLRPHVQPTGIALLALAGESDPSGRIGKSINWLRRSIGKQTTSVSLAWAILGLKAHGIELHDTEQWLEAARQRTEKAGNSPHKLALLALAAKGWPR